MSDVPKKKFKGSYYDAEYFAGEKGGKSYQTADGTIKKWSYFNPTGEWAGCRDIVAAWKQMFTPDNLLDVGCGRGQIIAYARDIGIKAEGFDFSEWAVSDEGRYSRCKNEWLKIHDATNPWPYEDNSYDLVTALDFYEHIYEEDLYFVIEEMFRVAKRHIFLLIATVDGIRETGYILKKGNPIPWDDARTWAGHTTVQTPDFWYDRLERDDWFFMRGSAEHFYSLVDPNITRNWVVNTIIVLEKFDE